MPVRILVISDDANLEQLLTQTMRGEGHDVLTARTGPDGLRSFANERPDLVLMDAGKAAQAAETVRRIRAADGPGIHTPILMVGSNEPAARVTFLRAGADDYQDKPIHPAELAARARRLLARFAPRGSTVASGPVRGRVHAFYGAKGGVGTTTVAINAAIALHRLRRKVVLVDANLQFGDHRVFLDLGPERSSIVDAVNASSIDSDLLRSIVVHHPSGIDLLLAPPSPEQAELVSSERHHMAQVVEALRMLYDYVVVDVDKRLDDHSLDIVGAADRLFVVMTADLSCLKNVRLVLETMTQIGVPAGKVELLLNRSNAFTGISLKSIEGVLGRTVEYQIINDYRAAISALNSGDPFMVHRSDSPIGRSVLEFVRTADRDAPKSQSSALRQRLLPTTT